MSINESETIENLPASDFSGLPGPSALPAADIIIFDGKCNFCIGQVRRLQKWDGNDRLAFLSLHDKRVEKICPELSKEQLMEQMFVVTKEGKYFGGAAALRYLSRKLPKLWIAAPLFHIPFSLPVWQWMYRKVAERRYQIAGKNEDCEGGTCDIHFGKK